MSSRISAGPARPVPEGQTKPLPLYQQVGHFVSDRIVTGRWPPGFVLPAENALAVQLDVSVGTVRRALADLTQQGLVVRHPRTGTVVTGRSPRHTLRHFYDYFRLHGTDGGLVRSVATTLSVKRAAATQAEREALRLGPAAERPRVVRVERTRLIENAPVMLDRMVMAQALVPDFPRAAGAVPERLYQHLLDAHGIQIAAVRENVSADMATDDDLRRLKVGRRDRPAAILVVEAIAFDTRDRPVVFATHRALTKQFRYVNEIR